MLSLARRLGVTFPLAEATDAANRAIPGRIADLVASLARAQGRIGILGLSYKPDTPVIDESQAILIAQLLLKRGFAVQAYDPLAMESARKVFAGRMQFMDSAQACIQNADVVLIATPWKQFRTLDYAPDGANSRATVIDCWGLLDGINPNGASVIRVGINSTAELNDRPQRTRSMDSIETVDELER
jgi:UDPglucose 6-dehydrogenase